MNFINENDLTSNNWEALINQSQLNRGNEEKTDIYYSSALRVYCVSVAALLPQEGGYARLSLGDIARISRTMIEAASPSERENIQDAVAKMREQAILRRSGLIGQNAGAHGLFDRFKRSCRNGVSDVLQRFKNLWKGEGFYTNIGLAGLVGVRRQPEAGRVKVLCIKDLRKVAQSGDHHVVRGALQDDHDIGILDLSRCRLDGPGMQVVADSLNDQHDLRVLQLDAVHTNHNPFEMRDHTQISNAMCQILRHQPRLQAFSCAGNRFSNGNTASVIRALQHCPHLNTFIGDHNLSVECGSDALATLIEQTESMQYLSMEDCHLDIGQICRALRNNRSLLNVNIGTNNYVERESGYELAACIRENTTLQYLDVTGKGTLGMTDEEAVAVAEALKQNTTLKVLRLKDVPMSHQAVRTLLDALLTNTTLETLDLSGLTLYDGGLDAFVDALPEEINSRYFFMLGYGRSAPRFYTLISGSQYVGETFEVEE